MFKVIIFATVLAIAKAGYLGAPVAAPVAAYSAAPAVSSSYFHQAHPPTVAAYHAAPAVAAYHAAPAVAAYHAAPAVTSYHAAPAVPAYHAAPAITSYHAAPAVAAYHAAPVVHAPAIGSSHQSVLRTLGGTGAVSHYAKAVDSAFSSVRKYDTRITNDALAVAPVAAYAAHAAPLTTTITHAAPIAHATPINLAAHHAPLATYAAHAPVIAKTAAVAYSPAAVVSHATFSGFGAHYAW